MKLDTSMMLMLMILLSAIVLVVFTSPLMMTVYGQTATQQVAEVKEEVQSTAVQADTNSVLTLSGIAALGVGFLGQFIKNKNLTKSDKATDRDFGMSYLYMYKFVQAGYAISPLFRQILDQPIDSDPMNKDVTIREVMAKDANEWAVYLKTNLNAAPPSMTPSPSVIVADAATTTATSVKTPATPPAPATNTNTNTAN